MDPKREKCKQLMLQYFGPASAKMVDAMKDDEYLATCRKKVAALLGEEKAKAFDELA